MVLLDSPKRMHSLRWSRKKRCAIAMVLMDFALVMLMTPCVVKMVTCTFEAKPQHLDGQASQGHQIDTPFAATGSCRFSGIGQGSVVLGHKE